MSILYDLYDYRGQRPGNTRLVDSIFNPVSGEATFSRTDLYYPGKIPLFLTSTWQSMSLFNGQTGEGWIDNWSLYVLPGPEWLSLHLPTGEIARFQIPWSGGISTNPVVKDWKLEILNMRPTFRVAGGLFYEFGLSDGKKVFLRRLYNEAGDEIRFKRSAYGNLTSVSRSDGLHLDIHCDDLQINRISERDRITGQLKDVGSYRYDDDGRLVQVRSAYAGEWAYMYNEDGKLTHRVRPSGAFEALQLDSDNRLLNRRFRHGMAPLECAYPATDKTVIRRGGDAITEFSIDCDQAVLSSFRLADGRTVTYHWQDGRLHRVEAGEDTSLEFSYEDEWGLLASIGDGDQELLRIGYDDAGNPLSMNFRGLEWLLKYNQVTNTLSELITPDTSLSFTDGVVQTPRSAPYSPSDLFGSLAEIVRKRPLSVAGLIELPQSVQEGRADILLAHIHDILSAPVERTSWRAALSGDSSGIHVDLPHNLLDRMSSLFHAAFLGVSEPLLSPFSSNVVPVSHLQFYHADNRSDFVEIETEVIGRDGFGRPVGLEDRSVEVGFSRSGFINDLAVTGNSEEWTFSSTGADVFDIARTAHLARSEQSDGNIKTSVHQWHANLTDEPEQSLDAAFDGVGRLCSLTDGQQVFKRNYLGTFLETEQIDDRVFRYTYDDTGRLSAVTSDRFFAQFERDEGCDILKLNGQKFKCYSDQSWQVIEDPDLAIFRFNSETNYVTGTVQSGTIDNQHGIQTSFSRRFSDKEGECSDATGTDRYTSRANGFVCESTGFYLNVDQADDCLRIDLNGQELQITDHGDRFSLISESREVAFNTQRSPTGAVQTVTLSEDDQDILCYELVRDVVGRVKSIRFSGLLPGFLQNSRASNLHDEVDLSYTLAGQICDVRMKEIGGARRFCSPHYIAGQHWFMMLDNEPVSCLPCKNGILLRTEDQTRYTFPFDHTLFGADASSRIAVRMSKLNSFGMSSGMFYVLSRLQVFDNFFPFGQLIPEGLIWPQIPFWKGPYGGFVA
ncbi:putative deoxyribonuclease RhsB [Pseudovibrio axinellae]|uniref:Putative deoxyribonuclease RhsB n=1 Tax=Pseudovibrio axinellae TaxID=989403 RepID=A0A165VU29_9HYPH|nr:DUF6531 domain-containing protein [Pseudovibrio axinellae]KZL15444.1 putative deoxyribonuclease RhsB [Pseudovibrio axinellae]SER88826.1 YD repeat-containing protein [Pseudovibrio axinellae]